MKLKKILYTALGCTSVGLGTLGTVVPVLPTVPFFLLATLCFAKSSEKLHTWLIGTKLYKDNLETYLANGGMTKKTKARIMVTTTVIMGLSCLMAYRVVMVRIILGCVWVPLMLFFLFGIKTICAENPSEPPD